MRKKYQSGLATDGAQMDTDEMPLIYLCLSMPRPWRISFLFRQFAAARVLELPCDIRYFFPRHFRNTGELPNMRIAHPVVAVLIAMAWSSALIEPAQAAGPLTTAPTNSRWNYAASSNTATFLGNDQPGPASLEFKKPAMLGGTFSIVSDAEAVHLTSGSAPDLILAVAAKADGTTTKIKIEGGDDPHITVNDVQSPRLQGKWIQLARDPSPALTIELEHVTFATIHIEPGPGGGDGAGSAKAPTSLASAPTELIHDVSASKLIASERAVGLAVAKPCLRCNGTGKVTQQVQTGSHREGAFDVPDYQTETVTCSECNGTGIVRATDDALKRLCANFLKNLAHLNQDDPMAQDAISQSYDMITNSMIGDFKTWTMLNQNGRSVLSRPSLQTVTPVIAQVKILKVSEAQGGRRNYLARLVGTDQEVRIESPVSADRLAKGFALMGGLVDTSLVDADSKQKTPVVANGFLIAPPIDKSWKWWWDWQWHAQP
jgi:hypothetical protein